MRKGVSLAGLSIIFGILIGWGEEIIPFFNLNQWNIINVSFVVMLLSFFLVLLLISISDNFITDIVIIFLYVLSYIGIKLFLHFYTIYSVFTQERLVFIYILLIFSFVSAILLSIGKNFTSRHTNEISKMYEKGKVDLAFPIIFFLFALLTAGVIVVFEENVFFALPSFLNYLTILIVLSFLFAIFSFSEISGFFIGFSSIYIYFLLGRFISNNFDIAHIAIVDKNFFIVVLLYSIIFGLSTLLIAHSSRIFLYSTVYRRLIKRERVVPVKKQPAVTKKESPKEVVLNKGKSEKAGVEQEKNAASFKEFPQVTKEENHKEDTTEKKEENKDSTKSLIKKKK